MQFFRDNKTMIMGILLTVIFVYVYFTYFRSPASDALFTGSDTSAVSSDLLITLSQLHIITLDNTIFSDPVFLSLSDFGVQIDPQNVGRRNPFAPVGSN